MPITIDELHTEVIADAPTSGGAAGAAGPSGDPAEEALRLRQALVLAERLQQRTAAEGSDD